jgi:hypothetical protein
MSSTDLIEDDADTDEENAFNPTEEQCQSVEKRSVLLRTHTG